MKTIIIGIIIAVNLIIQSTLLQHIKLFNVLPNTGLILVISFSIYIGKNKGAIIGFFVGILQDIMYGQIIGLNACVYMISGYLVGLINRKVFKENLLIPFTLTALATIFYESAILVLVYLLGYRIELFNFFKKMLIIEVLYNSIFSVIIYIYVTKLYQSKYMKKRYY